MNLIHVYIQEHKAVRNLNISLGGKAECLVKDQIVDVSFRRDTTIYYRNYHCSAIIGANGVGKSSVLDFIESAYFPTDSSGLLIFLDDANSLHICQINYSVLSCAIPFERHDDYEVFAKNHNISLIKINNVSSAQAKFGYGRKHRHPLIQERALEEYARTKSQRKKYFKNLLSYYRWDQTENNLIQDAGFEFTFDNSSNKMSAVFPIDLLGTESQNEFRKALLYFEKTRNLKRSVNSTIEITTYLIELNLVSLFVELAAQVGGDQRKPVLAMLIFYFLKSHLFRKNTDISECIRQALEALRYEENWTISLEGSFSESARYDFESRPIDVDSMHERFESLQDLLNDIAESLQNRRTEINDSGSLIVLIEEFEPVSKIVHLASMLPRNLLSNISWGWRGVSTGEMARSHLFSETYNCSAGSKYRHPIIVIDEADLYLHPEWQRTFLDSYLNLLDRLDWRSSKPQLLFTTHSPIIVSDFLPQDIVSLFKDQDGIVRVKDSLGFGTNITNLFIDGMHIESTIGEHSRKAIVSLMQNANTQSLSDLDRELVNSMGNKFVREFLLKK